MLPQLVLPRGEHFCVSELVFSKTKGTLKFVDLKDINKYGSFFKGMKFTIRGRLCNSQQGQHLFHHGLGVLDLRTLGGVAQHADLALLNQRRQQQHPPRPQGRTRGGAQGGQGGQGQEEGQGRQEGPADQRGP